MLHTVYTEKATKQSLVSPTHVDTLKNDYEKLNILKWMFFSWMLFKASATSQRDSGYLAEQSNVES